MTLHASSTARGVTLADLERALGADLQRIGAAEPSPTEVTGVHISELRDPRPYLDGGELLLTTGLALTTHTARTRAYATALRGHGVAGLGLGLGPVHDEVPGALVRACDAVGLPLYAVPAPTPFLVVARTYWDLLASSGRADLNATLGAHRDLVRAARGANPVPAVVRVLATATGGWAAQLTPEGHVASVWPRRERREAGRVAAELDRLRGLGPHSAATFSIGDVDVSVQPLTTGTRLVGHLAVGTPRPVAADRQQLLQTATALLALTLDVRHAGVIRSRADRGAITRLVLDGHVGAARALAAARGIPAPADGLRLLVLIDAPDEEIVDTIEGIVRGQTRGPDAAWVDASDGVVSALLTRADADTARAVLTPRLGDARGALSPPLPLGDPVALGAIVGATRHAADAAAPGSLARSGSSSSTDPLAEGTRLVTALLALGRPEWTATTIEHLRAGCRWEATATAMGLHRNTIRHRITAIEQALDVSLADPDTASGLWVALRSRGLA